MINYIKLTIKKISFKKKVSWADAFVAVCFLTLDGLQPDALIPCYYDFPTMMYWNQSGAKMNYFVLISSLPTWQKSESSEPMELWPHCIDLWGIFLISKWCRTLQMMLSMTKKCIIKHTDPANRANLSVALLHGLWCFTSSFLVPDLHFWPDFPSRWIPTLVKAIETYRMHPSFLSYIAFVEVFIWQQKWLSVIL